MSLSEPSLSPPSPSLPALFLLCFKIGILSFGGGLSGWIYQEFVLRKQWIDEEDFSSSLAISQMLPGANVVNLVICIGEQLRGPLGAIAGVIGFLVGPFFAVIALYKLFDLLAGFALLPIISNGVAFAAIGLMLLMCVHGVRRAMRFPPSVIIIAVTAVLVGVLQWPLIPVVLAIAPVSVALAWRRG
ncbi:MAG: chrA [Rhizobium sp.]|nr:chrA [Rhizobium sp.]